MSSEALAVAVVSIAKTQRRRFFYAVWWSGPPTIKPFRKPDASDGGWATYEEALREAATAAGRAVSDSGSLWARAWMRVLRGQAAFEGPPPDPQAPKPERTERRLSAWAVLGLAPKASREEVKRAYRRKVLDTHPDRGGDPEVFRAVQRAYERLFELTREGKPRKSD